MSITLIESRKRDAGKGSQLGRAQQKSETGSRISEEAEYRRKCNWWQSLWLNGTFLFHFVHGPTHIAGNKLDLVLCNCPEEIDGVSTHSPGVGKFSSDHKIIEFTIRVKFDRANPVRRKVYDFKRGNFADLRSPLEHVPFDVSFSENIDEYWLAWKDLFLTAVSECIPIETVKDTNSPPWIDSEARHCLRKKYTALRKYRRKKTATKKLKLRTLS